MLRGVAQPGSALRSGRRGRRFESSHPDNTLKPFPRPAGRDFYFGATQAFSLERSAEIKRPPVSEANEGFKVLNHPHKGSPKVILSPRQYLKPSRDSGTGFYFSATQALRLKQFYLCSSLFTTPSMPRKTRTNLVRPHHQSAYTSMNIAGVRSSITSVPNSSFASR